MTIALPITVRPASPDDHDAIWSILEPTIRAGETMALDRAVTREAALAYWHQTGHAVFVAGPPEGGVRGTGYLRANQGGGGAHVCNAAFATHPDATGRGVARAMQFNFVVATSHRAIRLWKGIGMRVLARLPEAFDHPAHGLVDALIMHRTLWRRAAMPCAPARRWTEPPSGGDHSIAARTRTPFIRRKKARHDDPQAHAARPERLRRRGRHGDRRRKAPCPPQP